MKMKATNTLLETKSLLHAMCGKGAFTYDVSKILANFTPPPPLSATFSIERPPPPPDDVSICQTPPPPHFKVT